MILKCILLFLAAYVGMECVAWALHKYLLHGVLWNIHADHHKKDDGQFFEKNDLVFLFFAIPSMLMYMYGSYYKDYYVLSVASGITAYGLSYFLIHDVFIHRRFKWIKDSDSVYFRALRRAHKMHHKHLQKENGECFGMLWVPFRYFIDAWKQKRKQKLAHG